MTIEIFKELDDVNRCARRLAEIRQAEKAVNGEDGKLTHARYDAWKDLDAALEMLVRRHQVMV